MMIRYLFALAGLVLAPIYAASPFAGFYVGTVYTSISGNVTLAERPIGGAAFTIGSDGVINSSSDLSGTVTDAGAITWNRNSSGFTTGTIANGILKTSVSINNNGTVSNFRIEARSAATGIGQSNPLADRLDQINPTQSLRNINRVRWIGDRFVAVGGSGSFATSADGISWKRIGVPTVLALYDVAYGNGRYVVVGDSGARFTSTNGVDWITASGGNGPWTTVAYGNGKFVAGFFSGSVATSTDGVVWTPGPSLPASFSAYSGVDFVNGQFVGWTGSGLSFSPDASNWTNKTANAQVTLGTSLANHDRLAYGNGVWVAAGGDGLAYSSNGTAWTKATNAPGVFFGNMASVTFGNGLFVACTAADDLWISTNAVQWNRVEVIEFRSMAYGAGKFVGVGNEAWFSTDAQLWIKPSDNIFLQDFHEPGYIDPASENELVSTFLEGSSGTYYFGRNGYLYWYAHQFLNGSILAPRLTPETLRFAMNRSYGEVPVIVGNHGAMIRVDDRSTQPLAFNLLPPVTSADLVHGAKNGSTFIFVGTQGAIIYCTNFFRTNWTVAASGVTANLKHAMFYPTNVTGAPDQFIVVGENGTILTSPNGATWTKRDSGLGKTLVGSAWDKETKRFLAAAGDGTLLASTNGATWTVTTPLPAPRPLYFFNNSDPNFGFTGTVVGGGEDGLVIGHVPLGSGFSMEDRRGIGVRSLNASAIGNGRRLAVGDRTAAISFDGKSWTIRTNDFTLNSLTFGKGQFVATASGKGVAASGDGLSWQARTNAYIANKDFSAITYGGGRFAAVGGGGAIMISDDGLTWVNKSISSSVSTWPAITWHDGTFVAVGASGTVLISTNNGNSWLEKPLFIRDLRGVTYGNGQFVAVGIEGWAATSANGLTWATKQYPFISPVENRPAYRDVVFGGGVFYAPATAGDMGISTNGLDWQRAFTGTGLEFRGGSIGNGSILWVSGSDIYRLNVPDSGSPIITAPPSDASAVEGGTLVLTADAAGTDLQFAWLKDGVPLVDGGRISGANSKTLSITGMTAADAGAYTFTVSNSAGSRSSLDAQVTVASRPSIYAQPQSVNGIVGAKASLSVAASTSNVTYQWYKNGVAIPGATTAEFSIPSLAEGDAAIYYAVVSNAAGTVQSSPATINIVSAPSGLSLDMAWPAQPVNFASVTGSVIEGLGAQPSGKLLMGGYFTVNKPAGGSLTNIVRFNVDGSVDSSFNPPPFDYGPSAFYTLANGQILAMGYFDKIGSFSAKGLARLNNDGSVDTTYQPNIGPAYNGPVFIKPCADGKLLISGGFNQLGGSGGIKYVGLLNNDGTPDLSFTPAAINNQVTAFDFQSDGSIVVGGNFTAPKSRLLRLSASGALDAGFNAAGAGLNTNSAYPFPQIYSVMAASDSKVYAGGFFGAYNGVAAPSLIRLNKDGTLDTTFNANFAVTGSSVSQIMPFGAQLLVAGGFRAVGANTSVPYLAILDDKGAVGLGLNLAGPPNGAIQHLAADSSGGIFVAGSFTQIGNQSRPKVARLMTASGAGLPLAIKVQPISVSASNGAAAAFQVVATGSGALSFQWRKNGQPITGQVQSSLLISSVTAADAGSYTVEVKDSAGAVTSNPATLTVQGATTGGFATWAASFGLPAGKDAPNQDADADGYSNAAEFALGTNPMQASSKPQLQQKPLTVNNQIFPSLTYIRSKTATGVTIAVLASTSVTFTSPAQVVDVGTPEDLGNGIERVTVRSTVALPTVSKFFFEVKTTGN